MRVEWYILGLIAFEIALSLYLVLAPTPGPGFIFLLIGAAMLAARSRSVAVALDRFETWLRICACRLRKAK